MKWLNSIVDEAIRQHPDGEIIVSSGVSPSGTYHLGTLREVLTAEIVARELIRRGRQARHLHIVDDLDVFRKVPVDVSTEFDKYLGYPLCDVPAPDGSDRSYADFFLDDLLNAARKMNLLMEVVRSHEKYRAGFFVPVIEQALAKNEQIRGILEEISGRQLNDQWSPIQIVEPSGHIKNRQFKSIDESAKTVTYIDNNGQDQQASYQDGHVKLSWRIDWPARWSLLGVKVEPFGRDHATKGGSYETGEHIVQDVFQDKPPIPVPYNFIMKSGETKKMSKSAGDTITAADLLDILPTEIVWFFLLRYSPDKQLFFDVGDTLVKLFDDFAELQAKPDKTDDEQQLLELCLSGVSQPTVSNVPFSHLVASYQAALKDDTTTLAIIKRTEYAEVANRDAETIKRELRFIDNWLQKYAQDSVKFAILENVDKTDFSQPEQQFLNSLAELIEQAPDQADGTWFHETIYSLRQDFEMKPKDMFSLIYKAVIGQTSGPRAGWFLSTLPRDWLVERLKLKA